MNRRQFLYTTAAAAGALAGCVARARRPDTLVTTPMDAAAFHNSRRFVSTPFGRTAYVERGAGPVALFLHGFPLNSFQWRGALDRLAPYRRCVAPDWLGLGYTEVRPGQSVAPDAQAAMLAAFLDTLGIQSVDLVANDSGGAVAQLFVTRHPERVRTLLLTNCDTEPDSPPAAVLPVIEMARNDKFPDFLAGFLNDKVMARGEKGLGGACYSIPSQPTDEALETYLRPMVSTPARRALANAYALGLTPNPLAGVEAALKRCRVPVRIVWGMADGIFAPASADYLDRTLPGSRGVRRLPQAKLFFPEEYPDVIAEEARRLWGV